MQELADSFPTIFDAKTRGKEVLHQLRSPQTPMVAHLARTTADDLFDLRPWLCSQSRWAPRNWCVRESWETRLVDGMYPSAKGRFISIQPAGNRAATSAVHQPHNTVVITHDAEPI